MNTDPIADLLVRLQNASRVGHTSIEVPFSAMKMAIARVLATEGYVGDADKKNNSITIALKYQNGTPAISGVKRVSKQSRRIYMGVRDVRPIKRGRGLLVLSTPKGIMSGKTARTERVGGEALFEIW